MPLPFLLLGGAVAAGLAGLAKTGEALSNNDKAQQLIDSAKAMYDESKDDLESQREITSEDLDSLGRVKITSWSDDIGTFSKLYSMFKKVELQGDVELNSQLKLQISSADMFQNMQTASMKATEIMNAGFSSLGAGALAGVASYGGAMLFASASTGTAIASLSGVAATNATLAWFGGGSLAAGGLGIAGGTFVLGGIVAGPVLAVAGFIMAAKSEENLAKAEETYSEAELACEKMKTMVDFMKGVSRISKNYEDFIISFSKRYKEHLAYLSKVRQDAYETQKNFFMNRIRKFLGAEIKIDYAKLDKHEQEVLHITWLMTQILYSALTAPILTDNGDLDENVTDTLYSIKESSKKILGSGI